ncbi:hypothetical protein HYU96_02325, partial [Candidatus Daviesbacteria bacterium]|nr:hypothetical protein [Candidatus Daviesbacteria bacterium]
FTLASGETKQLWWGLNPPPANLTVDKPACSETPYSVTLNWANTGPVLWADIDDDPNFNSFSNKDVSNQTSAAAPAGFNPALTFNPATTYFWRMRNEVTHTLGGGWTVNACLRPWIRVTGDVHSDEAISLPGGP